MDVNIDGIITWLKNWFYDKTESDNKYIAKGNIQGGVNLLGQWQGDKKSGGNCSMPTRTYSHFHETPIDVIDNQSVSDTSDYSGMKYMTKASVFQPTDVFTFSFWAKGDVNNTNNAIRTYFYNGMSVRRLYSNSDVDYGASANSSNDGSTLFNLTDEWQLFTVTYQIKEGGTNQSSKYPLIRVYGGCKCSVSSAKLERGFNATDYSPCDEIPINLNYNIDYNDYKNDGNYFVWNSQQTGNTNKPPNDTQGGLLTVKSIPNGCIQILYNYYVTSPKVYYRIFHSTGGWKDWQTITVNAEPSSSKGLADDPYNGTVGTSTKYAREDHAHGKLYHWSTGGVSTATYVDLLEFTMTTSWQDIPITFVVRRRAKDRAYYVSIRFSNTDISTSTYSVTSFKHWGDVTAQTFYLRKVADNTYRLCIYKTANDAYFIDDMVNFNSGITITKIASANGNYGTTAPSGSVPNLYTSTQIGVPDTDVTWNGVATSNSVSPVMMATGEDFNANRLAYFDPTRISVQYSTDGGSNWINYSSVGVENRQRLCMNGVTVYLGNNSTTDRTKNRLRITFDFGDVGANSILYMISRKLAIYSGTNNATGFTCQVQTQTYAQYDSNTETFSNYGSAFTLGGNSGWNTFPINVTIGGNASQTTNTSTRIKALRLVFTQTGGTGNALVSRLRLYGETAYRTSSNYANNGHIYYADINQNATFPNKIIKSGGTSQEMLLANGDTKQVSEYIVGTHGTTATNVWTGTCSNLTEIKDGTVIYYYLTSAGASNVTLNLTLADGTTTGAKNVYFKGTTRLSTQYPINSIVTLVYTTKIDNGAWYVASANDNNSYNANEYGGVQTKCGGTITSGALAGAKASDKKYYTLSSGLVLDTSYPIVQYNANKTTSDTNTNQLYNKRYDCLITTTKSMTLTAPNPVYIEGTSYKDGKFTVSSNVLTQTLTNGRFYWLIGFAYDSTHIRFGQYEKIRYYDGTNLSPAVETIDSTYYRYSLSSSKYDVDINDGSYTITARVVDSQGNPVSGRTLVLLENGNTMLDTNLDDASTKTTNSNGVATWEIPIGDFSYNADPVLKWGLFNYSIEGTDVNCQVYIDGWYYLQGTASSSYALMRNKNYAKLWFRGWHPASDVTTSWVQLGSSGMALDALPHSYFEGIGFVNTTIFYIRVQPSGAPNPGNVEIRCGSGTISKNNDFYMDVMWAIKE